MASYPNAWTGWEAAVLAAAKLPNTLANRTFLAVWHTYEGSNAKNNPLNTTLKTSGSLGSINSAGVQSYSSAQAGAQATASTLLNNSAYSGIVAGLKSGDIYAYSAKSSTNVTEIVKGLSTWGSHNFAAVFQYEAPPSAAPGTEINQDHTNPATGQQVQSTTQGADPFGIFGGLISWIKEYAIRTAEVIGGFFMLLVGLYLLARQVGLATNPPGPVGDAVGAVS